MIIHPDPKMGLRALTIRQPYASDILGGLKTVEYRDWSTHYRGDFLVTVAQKREWGHAGPYACTLCVVRLTDVRRGRHGYEWLLAEPRAVENVPVKGALKLWKVTDALRDQLGLQES